MQEEIISLAFEEMGIPGFWPEEGKRICSPFRDDKEGKCYFEWYKGYLRLVDYGYPELHNMNCWSMLMRAKGFSHVTQAMAYVRSLGKLTFDKRSTVHREFKLEWEERDHNTQDINYWTRFGIMVEEIMEDNVCFIDNFKHNTKDNPYLFYHKKFVHAYGYKFEDRIKIYTPYQEPRFISTCKSTDLFFMNYPKKTDTLFITKSYKDGKILLVNGFDARAVQGEGNRLEKNCPEVIYKLKEQWDGNLAFFYDADQAGFRNSIEMATLFGVKAVTLPDFFFQRSKKDPGEVMSRYGQEGFDYAMKNLQIIYG